ncbi:hypothetical protein YA0089_26230 [Pseudomonas viridiflava]|uniref:hypothetical protein n=1 Tax=Pseudomonas viridiflava TaxID=33069 RepID=UPI0018E6442E|nr:hypothetical protein [Pseudomonas viridiflava]MBI6727114.1 hypothetical protein [Pseudomonas viridiflava]
MTQVNLNNLYAQLSTLCQGKFGFNRSRVSALQYIGEAPKGVHVFRENSVHAEIHLHVIGTADAVLHERGLHAEGDWSEGLMREMRMSDQDVQKIVDNQEAVTQAFLSGRIWAEHGPLLMEKLSIPGQHNEFAGAISTVLEKLEAQPTSEFIAFRSQAGNDKVQMRNILARACIEFFRIKALEHIFGHPDFARIKAAALVFDAKKQSRKNANVEKEYDAFEALAKPVVKGIPQPYIQFYRQSWLLSDVLDACKDSA